MKKDIQMTKEFTPVIFIADDNPNNIKVLSTMLESKGYDTRVALNGEQALTSIRQCKPDLILLDVHMPKMDGYQVCEALKNDEELKDISVIFISALNETFNKIQGFKLGAVDYIEKPFQIEEVEIRIETQLKLKYYQNRLEEKARFSEESLKLAAEVGRIGVWEWNAEADIMLWDDRMMNIHGVEKQFFSEKSAAWFTLIHEDDREKVKNTLLTCLSENRQFDMEFQIIKPDNTSVFVSAKAGIFSTGDGSGKKVVGVALDTTDRVLADEKRRKMETKLHQSRKMEAMGNLASGVAHDFNNILTGIFGYAQLIVNNKENPEKVVKSVRQITIGAERASELIQQILTFSRKQAVVKQTVRVDYLIKEVIGLIKPSIPKNVVISKHISSEAKVLADPTQIHQVLMNLCANANYSMADTGGELTISLEDIELTQTTVFGAEELAPGSYVKLEVRDTGKGMDTEEIQRIFEPYFTTKSPGDGTGLGLAVVQGIVQKHGGFIEAFSSKGEGSLFKIFLPVINNVQE